MTSFSGDFLRAGAIILILALVIGGCGTLYSGITNLPTTAQATPTPDPVTGLIEVLQTNSETTQELVVIVHDQNDQIQGLTTDAIESREETIKRQERELQKKEFEKYLVGGGAGIILAVLFSLVTRSKSRPEPVYHDHEEDYRRPR